MKRLLLLFCTLFLINYVSAQVAPYCESFDSGSTPTGWSISASSGGPWDFNGIAWNTTTCSNSPLDHTTGAGLDYAAMDFSNTDAAVILETPDIDVSALTTPYLEFYHFMCTTGYSPANELYVEAWNGAVWNQVALVDYGADEWQLRGFSLLAHVYNVNFVKLRFRAESGNATVGYDYNGDLAIDDVCINEAPTCYDPTSLTASNITSSSAELAWTENTIPVAATAWEVEIVAAGASTTGTGVAATNPYTAASLSANTSYDYYVRTDCTGGDYSDWVGPFNFATPCVPFTAPYAQSFDGTAEPEIDACWTVLDVSSNAGDRIISDSNPYYNVTPSDGVNAIEMYNAGSTVSNELLLISPVFSDFDNTKRIRFNVYDYSSASDLIIGTMSDPSDNTTFTPFVTIAHADMADDVWEEKTVSFDTYVGADKHVAFAHGMNSTFDYIHLDAFVYEDIPSCIKPSDVAASNITGEGADLAWTEENSTPATDWEIEIVTTGSPATGTGVAATNPYTATGLAGLTSYDVYVRADCGGGDYSAWTNAYTFTTLCADVVPYYTASMTNVPPDACWDEAASGDPTAGPSGLGTSDWRTNRMYNGTASNAMNLYASADQEWLISNNFDLSTGGPYRLVVNVAVTDYSFSGNTTAGDVMGSDDEVQLLMTTDGGTTWTNLTTWTVANQPDEFGVDYIEDLTAQTGTVGFAIWATDGAIDDGEDYDFHIGEFTVEDIPACPEPLAPTASNLTDSSAELSWTQGGSESLWNIEWGATGFTQGTGTVVTGVTNPYTLMGLAPATDYDYYVEADCGGSGTSIPEGPYSFTTPCVPFTATYSQSFDGTTEPEVDVCWTVLDNSSDTNDYIGTDATPIGTTPNDGANSITLYNYESTVPNELLLVSPEFSDLDNTKRIRFDVYDYSNTSDLIIGTMSDPMDNATFTPFVTITEADMADDVWEEKIVNFDTYVGTDKYIAFAHGMNDNYDYIHIDAFVYEEIPTCFRPSDLAVANITGSTAEFSWTENNTPTAATAWEVEVVAGGTLPTGTGLAAATNPYTATALSPNTNYDYYVRADCGGGDYSPWEGPLNFTTTCLPFTATYTQSFDGTIEPEIDLCWSVLDVSASTFDYIRTDASPSGASTPFEGLNSVVLYNSSSTTSNQLLLVSPEFSDFSDTKRIRFYVYDDSNGSDLIIGTMSDPTDNTTFTPFMTITEADMTNDVWEEKIVSFNGYVGTDKHIAFAHGMNSTYDYIHIDAFVYEDVPNCVAPTDLAATAFTGNSANLSWTENTPIPATAWEVEVVLEGAMPTGTGVAAGTNPYTATSLNPLTSYDYYVRADCGAGGYSAWAGPFTFQTICASVNAFPYTMTFDALTASNGGFTACITADNIDASSCWFNDANNTNMWTARSVATGSTNTGPTTDHTGSGNYVFLEASSCSFNAATLYSPIFDLSGLTNPVAKFWYHLYGAEMGSLLVETTTDGTIWTPVGSAIAGNQGNNWQQALIDLSSAAGSATVQVRFVGTIGTSFGSDIAIDDFMVEDNATPLPTTITAAAATADMQCLDLSTGWTHYWVDATNEMVLSIAKNNQNIGSVGDGSVFAVNAGGTDGSVVDLSAAPYVLNTSWYTLGRFWDVTPSTQPTVDVAVRTYFSLADHAALAAAVSSTVTMADMHFYKINGNYDADPSNGHTTVPAAAAATYDANGYWEMANGATAGTDTWALGTIGSDRYAEYLVASFSGGGGGGGNGTNGALPVELISFTGKADEKVNVLNWTTASEINNSHFEIEYSINGEDFTDIARVEGAGNSVIELDYNFIDENPTTIAYYRLKQVDYSGEYAYSNIVTVVRSKTSLSFGTIRPNPTKGNTNIQFNTADAGSLNIIISNVDGKVVMNKVIEANKGLNDLPLDLSHLVHGVYYISLDNNADKVTTRIIKIQ